ncbi:hypothetical protein GCM10011579_025660 [Streptomyces albiflavescens]|uniref:Uncharacterized protein n=1 Tax=Streptomyces albiflavescens TaxID=1623582 RepID=A0A918D2W1_9ACTN|nr:hypothetical protein GCM10011579_025660 [Streptomyces albiflavescens]
MQLHAPSMGLLCARIRNPRFTFRGGTSWKSRKHLKHLKGPKDPRHLEYLECLKRLEYRKYRQCLKHLKQRPTCLQYLK